MARVLACLALLVALVGCGGSAPAASGDGGGGGGGGNGGGGNGGGGGDLPGLSVVLFGTSYDQTTLAVTGKGTQFKAGSPLVAVGRALAPQPASGVQVQIGSSGSTRLPLRPVSASDNPDNAQLFATDLTGDKLPPGSYIVSFLGASGRTLASGNVTILP